MCPLEIYSSYSILIVTWYIHAGIVEKLVKDVYGIIN